MFEAPTTPPPQPAGITDANVPADRGLSGLGLLMSLTGAIFFVMAAGTGTLMMVALMLSGGDLQGAGIEIPLILAVITASVVRSWAHRAAGQRLLYDGPGTPRSAMRRYFVLAGVQTLLIVAALASQSVPGKFLWSLLVMLAGWPVALAIIFAGARWKALLDQSVIPQGEDRGFEGAAILMVVFGLTGLLFGVVMAIGTLEQIGPMLTSAPFIELSLLAMIALLIGRSALHVRAGVAGMRQRHPDHTTAVVVKYSNFAVLAAAIICGVMFLMTLIESEGRMAGPAIFLMLITVVFALWGLSTWPALIKRFFVDRQFADLLANGEAPPARAPDRGLTTLGWLLFGQAVMALTMALPVLLWSSPLDPDDYDRARDPMSQMFGAFQAGGAAQWWTIGAAALQLVAAWQLIQMRPNHKRLVTLWGVAASLVAVYVNYPLLEVMIRSSLHEIFGGSQAMLNNLAFMMVAIALIVPIAALALVHRKHRELPTAVLHK